MFRVIYERYGKIVKIEVKTPMRGSAFAFVEFDSARDAKDAARGRDNYDFDGYRLKVEISHGGSRKERMNTRHSDFGGIRNSNYRVTVKGLPVSASWQDLKDHFRKVVIPSYVNVERDRDGVVGIVEFESGEDMEKAIRKLDDTEFRNPFDRKYIKIREDRRGRSRSQSRGRSRSRSRSRKRDSRSRSRSRSHGRSRNDSRSSSYSRDRSSSRDRGGKSQFGDRGGSVSPRGRRSRSSSRSISRDGPNDRKSKSRSRSRSASENLANRDNHRNGSRKRSVSVEGDRSELS